MNRFRTIGFRCSTLLLILFGLLTTQAVHGQTNAYKEAVPYWPTNSYWTSLEIDPALYDSPYHISLFNPTTGEDSARLWSQTKSVFFYGLGVVGVLALMPESMTGWETTSDVFGKWLDNVSEAPDWDRDNWIYNYVGHTYSGGVYYQVARKSGYRQWDSFIYATLMSTLYWEYGVEALAEDPSFQDLFVTPILGWVYGEWAYQTELGIRDRNNEVIGSKILGETCLFLLDPIDSLGRGVNRMAGRSWIKAGYGYFSYTATPAETGMDTDHTVYLNMNFPIGGSSELEDKNKPSRIEYRNDPVDTGIVGISIGSGHTILDDKWGKEDDFYSKVTLGLYFTPRFSARMSFARGEVESDAGPVDYEYYGIDTQYYLFSQYKLRPFVTAGFNDQLWDKDDDLKTFQVNGGLGLHWQIHRKWALQADWINYYSTSKNTYDQTVNATLVYRFGQGEHNDW